MWRLLASSSLFPCIFFSDSVFQLSINDVVERLRLPRRHARVYNEDEVWYVRNLANKRKDVVPMCILGKQGTLDEHRCVRGDTG